MLLPIWEAPASGFSVFHFFSFDNFFFYVNNESVRFFSITGNKRRFYPYFAYIPYTSDFVFFRESMEISCEDHAVNPDALRCTSREIQHGTGAPPQKILHHFYDGRKYPQKVSIIRFGQIVYVAIISDIPEANIIILVMRMVEFHTFANGATAPFTLKIKLISAARNYFVRVNSQWKFVSCNNAIAEIRNFFTAIYFIGNFSENRRSRVS